MATSKPSRFLAKLTLTLLVFVLLSITAVAFFGGPILEYAIPKITQRYGIEIEQLKLTNPTLSQVNIAKIQGFIRPRSSDIQAAPGGSAALFHIDIERASINYDLSKLLASAWNGILDETAIEAYISQLTIDQNARTPNSPPSDPVSIGHILLAGVNYTRLSPPFQLLTIDQFTYRYPRSSAQTPPFELSGMVSAQTSNEGVRISLQTTNFLLSIDQPSRQPNDQSALAQIQAELAWYPPNARNEITIASLQCEWTDHKVHAQLHIDLSHANELADGWQQRLLQSLSQDLNSESNSDSHEFLANIDPHGATIDVTAQRQGSHWHTTITLQEIDIKTANGTLNDLATDIILVLPDDLTSPLLSDVLSNSQFTAAKLTTNNIVSQNLSGIIAGRVEISDDTLAISLTQPTTMRADHVALRPNSRTSNPPTNLTNLTINPIIQVSANRSDLSSPTIIIQPDSAILAGSVTTKALTISGLYGQLTQASELFINSSNGPSID